MTAITNESVDRIASQIMTPEELTALTELFMEALEQYQGSISLSQLTMYAMGQAVLNRFGTRCSGFYRAIRACRSDDAEAARVASNLKSQMIECAARKAGAIITLSLTHCEERRKWVNSSWISVNEILPRNNRLFVLATDGEWVGFAAYASHKGKWVNDEDQPIEGITHWQNIPLPPKK